MRYVVLLALVCLGCATHSSIQTAAQRAEKWDVFWYDKGEIKVSVIPSNSWVFRDGCFVSEKPFPYIQCEVVRIRPCTEDCG